jgi:hypothetical protein
VDVTVLAAPSTTRELWALPLVTFFDLGEAHPDWTFYPIYTARLGRGRIICCNFDVSLQPAKDLSRATGDAFTRHCVEWLAAGQAAAATQPVEGL